jgi:hypothetical protein
MSSALERVYPLLLVVVVGCAPEPRASNGVPAAAWARIEARIAADQRVFVPSDGAWHAGSNRHPLTGAFDGDGARFEDGRAPGGWHLDLRLSAIGREDGPVVALGSGTTHAVGDRLTRALPGVDEWWIDAEEAGFEHGFDVLGPPAGAGDLRLVLATEGLAARDEGAGVSFADTRTRLRYDGLVATDATGQQLPAWFEASRCTEDACEVEVRVAIDGAAWPVVVDPMLAPVVGTEKLASDASPGSWYGFAVAAAGDTIAVGAPGDPLTGSAGGAVYLLERNSGGADAWSQVKVIAAPVGAGAFGASLALSANVLAVGAPGDSGATGTVLLYERNTGGAGTWGLSETLAPTTALLAGDEFGAAVELFGERAVAVGAPGRGADAGMVLLFGDIAGTWVEAAALNGQVGSRFGTSLASASKWLAVGAPAADGVFVYEVNTLGQVAALSSGFAGGAFGHSIAFDGDRLVVGSPAEGAARVYQRAFAGASWAAVAHLAPTPGAPGTRFGVSVAVEDEGVAVADTAGLWVYEQNTASTGDGWSPAQYFPGGANTSGPNQVALVDHVLVAGQPRDAADTGSVEIRRRAEGAWAAPDVAQVGAPSAIDLGRSVAVSGDVVVVGAPLDDTAFANAGAAYVFERNAGGVEAWGQTAVMNGGGMDWRLGSAVAVQGSLLAIGAPNYNASTGKVLMYQRSAAGWSALREQNGLAAGGELGASVAVCLTRVLAGAPGPTAQDVFLIDPGNANTYETSNIAAARLGESVACDGTRLVAGAPDANGLDGLAYLFLDDPGASLVIQATLLPNTPLGTAGYGSAVAISGRTIALGGPGDTGAAATSGAVQIFRQTGTSTWTWQRDLVGAGGAAGDSFGAALALDGDRLLVGSPGFNGIRGAAWLFERNQGGADTWGQLQQFTAAAGALNDGFGTAVDLVGGTVVVGVPLSQGGMAREGAAFVLDDATALPPTALADDLAMLEDGPQLAGNVLVNDFDGNGDPLVNAALAVPPANGTATVAADGAFTYDPDLDFFGVDSFQYTVSDGALVSTATVTIDVTAVNDPPVGVVYNGNFPEDGAFQLDLDASDVDGAVVSYALFGLPPELTVLSGPDASGVVDLQPTLNFAGPLAFGFRPTDDLGMQGATTAVNLAIDPVNDPPVAVADAYGTPEDTALVVPGLLGMLANDTDVENNPLAVDAPGAIVPSAGTLAAGTGGGFTWTPPGDFSGVATWSYRSTDGAAFSAPTLVTVTVTAVNDRPVATPFVGNMAEEATVDFFLGGTDVDSAIASFALTTGSANATEALDPVTGKLTVTPNLNFNGLLSMAFTVTDAQGLVSAPAPIDITVTPVNDPPVAVADVFFVDEDTLLVIDAASGLLANDSDVDGDPLTVLNPASLVGVNGALTVNADGSLTYQPFLDDVDGEQPSYRCTDGSLNSPLAPLIIQVTPVNDPPVAQALVDRLDEDATVDFFLVATDVDSAIASYQLVNSSTDATALLDPATGKLTVTPNPDFNGVLSLSFTATDVEGEVSDPASITLTVDPLPDTPVAVDDAWLATEDTLLAVDAANGLLANDADGDGDPLVVVSPASIVGQHGALTVNADGSFTWLPAQDDLAGEDLFYAVSDGALVSLPAGFSITVTPVNDPPSLVDDAAATPEDTPVDVPVLANDGDVDGDALTVIAVSAPAHGFASTDGTIVSWTPGQDRTDPVSVVVTITDGTVNLDSTLDLTVLPLPDPPVGAPDAFVGDEDVDLAGDVLANDLDVDSALVAELVTPPAVGTVILAADGTFTWVTPLDWSGVDGFAYQLRDDPDFLVGPIPVTLEKRPVDDAPRPVDDALFLAEEDPAAVTNVLANDLDPEGDLLTASLLVPPIGGVATVDPDGTLTYTVFPDFSGLDEVVYLATANGLSTAASVWITVTPIDDAPVAVEDAFAGPEDLDIVGNVLSNDFDPDGDPLVATLDQPPGNGAVVLQPDGSFVYTPNLDFTGVDAFGYVLSANGVFLDPVLVTLTLDPLPDPPRGVADLFEGPEDQVLAGDVLANDVEPDGEPMTAALAQPAQFGLVVLAPDGTFTYTAFLADFNGADVFTYVPSDPSGPGAETTVDLLILPVDDPPVAFDDAFDGIEGQVIAGNVLENDVDIDGDPLTATVVTPPVSGALTLAADGSLAYTPNAGFSGQDAFTYVATGAGVDSNVATVSLDVTALDDAPVGVADVYQVDVNGSLADNVLANDFDPNGDPLTAALETVPLHGSLVLEPDGDFVYTPFLDYAGDDAFTYVATAGGVSTPGIPVAITVGVVPDETGDTALPPETGDTGGCVATPWYEDKDEDGFGDPDLVETACAAPPGYVATAGDCNDLDPAINPEGTEVANDRVDQDCTDGDLRVVGQAGGCGCAASPSAPPISLFCLPIILLAARRRTAPRFPCARS